jgi:hypothetical protein
LTKLVWAEGSDTQGEEGQGAKVGGARTMRFGLWGGGEDYRRVIAKKFEGDVLENTAGYLTSHKR